MTSACHADDFTSNVGSADELEYGAVLFDYYQRNYFGGLIEQQYAQAIKNPKALSTTGQLLEGGMTLSYGLADKAENIFDEVLATNAPEDVRNRAWFYLAKLHYSKSDIDSALATIDRVKGDIPPEILVDYHYLATLLHGAKNPLATNLDKLDAAAKQSPYFPYLLFNVAIAHLRVGNLVNAVTNLEKVTEYSGTNEELSVLADRARHGLAELALQSSRLPDAWNYLNGIRTNGLYSNRALLSYVWAAINQQQYQEAIPALETLSQRSIALPEVQEAKVLLAHVYEQNGQISQALQRNISAEKEFKNGVALIDQARRIIKGQDVPREFIGNLEAMMDDTDWYASRPSVDYQTLTPFLVDLMASNAFTEAMRELADLYVIEDNLKYWSDQTDQHALILAAADKKSLTDEARKAIHRSNQLKEAFAERSEEINLYALVLSEEERAKLTSLLETTATELALLEDKARRLEKLDEPYVQPAHYKTMVADNHARIQKKLVQTEKQILALETIMRKLINIELDKHQDRMTYYSAQSRLAKARLYDMRLLSLEHASNESNTGTAEKGQHP